MSDQDCPGGDQRARSLMTESPTELEIMCSSCWEGKSVDWGEPVLDRSSPGVIWRCPVCLTEWREEKW